MNNLEQYDIDPELDRVLGASAPNVMLAGMADEQVIRSMVSAAKREAAPERRPKRSRRMAGMAVVLGLGLGGVGRLLRLSRTRSGLRGRRARDSVHLHLAQRCCVRATHRRSEGADPEAVEATRTFFRTHDVLALADIEGTIAWLRTDDHSTVDDAGRSRPTPYGSEGYMSPDTEYQVSVGHAVAALVADELAGTDSRPPTSTPVRRTARVRSGRRPSRALRRAPHRHPHHECPGSLEIPRASCRCR
ncbi:hypothetical protein NKG05_04780 [Oerskovia sp. M15]